MPGQLYALVALRLIDDREFDRIIDRYRSSKEKVTTISGDLFNEQPVAALADEIAGGRYDVRLYPGSESLPEAAWAKLDPRPD